MKEIKLPSGAMLKVQVAPFIEGKALYKALLRELKTIKIDSTQEIDANLYKDLVCAVMASDEVEKAIEACMKRCLYRGVKITEDTWEKEEHRDDYFVTCFHVAKENLLPFVKSLYAEFKVVFDQIVGDLALRLPTTHS